MVRAGWILRATCGPAERPPGQMGLSPWLPDAPCGWTVVSNAASLVCLEGIPGPGVRPARRLFVGHVEQAASEDHVPVRRAARADRADREADLPRAGNRVALRRVALRLDTDAVEVLVHGVAVNDVVAAVVDDHAEALVLPVV